MKMTEALLQPGLRTLEDVGRASAKEVFIDFGRGSQKAAVVSERAEQLRKQEL